MSAKSQKKLRIGDIYAQAVFETAQDQQMLGDVKSDLDSLGNVFNEATELKELLWSPYFTRQYKADLLEKLFAGKFSQLTMNFLMVVARHNRLKFLPEIIAGFSRLWDQRHGLVPVSITVSKNLDDLRIKKLCDEIASSLERKIRLTQSIVDPSIIGGIIIHYGDRVIDNTIRMRLLNAVQTITSQEKRWIKFDEV
ncbi:MAG: ATP synthase F1 subunit delta [Sedimentisphaerales bacterium]